MLKGPHIHLDIIHVGDVDADDEATIDAAVHVCRTVYGTVELGVGRVRHFVISEDDADGMDVIDSSSEKGDLLGAWTATLAIDVFMVRDITYDSVVGSAGYIPDNCGDTPESDEDGVIVDVNGATAAVQERPACQVEPLLLPGGLWPAGDFGAAAIMLRNGRSPITATGCAAASALDARRVRARRCGATSWCNPAVEREDDMAGQTPDPIDLDAALKGQSPTLAAKEEAHLPPGARRPAGCGRASRRACARGRDPADSSARGAWPVPGRRRPAVARRAPDG